MTIRPLSDKLVIKVIDDSEKTTGGIFIPDSAKEKPQRGEVVSAGPGRMLENATREEMDVKVGEIVLFAKYSGTDVKLNDVVYKILSIRDVLGVIS